MATKPPTRSNQFNTLLGTSLGTPILYHLLAPAWDCVRLPASDCQHVLVLGHDIGLQSGAPKQISMIHDKYDSNKLDKFCFESN